MYKKVIWRLFEELARFPFKINQFTDNDMICLPLYCLIWLESETVPLIFLDIKYFAGVASSHNKIR